MQVSTSSVQEEKEKIYELEKKVRDLSKKLNSKDFQIQENSKKAKTDKVRIKELEKQVRDLKNEVRCRKYETKPISQKAIHSVVMTTSFTSHTLVAAFDFGTTYSGYAFSFRNNPLKIVTNQMWASGGAETLISLKTPTCVLLDRNGKFHSFGYQAEDFYARFAEENKHHDWMLFRQTEFKMILYENKKLTRNTMIDDITGKKMEAIKIMSTAIRYLKDHLLATLNLQTTGMKEEQIFYVLTVPAIWDDSANLFMREAAENAGIDGSRLKLALEPEAASLWCQSVADEARAALCGTGTRYMVVDLGGGTADITVHEKLDNGSLKKLHNASGGPWGGMYVDINYLERLRTIFGDTALEHLKKHEMVEYFDVIREFETKKSNITATSMEQITFRIPASLREKSEFGEDDHLLHEKLERLNLSGSVSAKRNKMQVHPDVVRRWFDGPVDNVISHIQVILGQKDMEGVNTILLVGGFGESAYVYDRFKNALSNKQIIVPAEAGLAVLKGAVRFGHAPDTGTLTESQRIMQYTYGLSVSGPFDENVHPASLMVTRNGENKVDNIFHKFVCAGDFVAVGQEVVKRDFQPTDFVQSVIDVYCSTDCNPSFTTEESCTKLGEFIVEHPEGETLGEKEIDVTFVFGDTELIVKATVQKTRREFYTRINCL